MDFLKEGVFNIFLNGIWSKEAYHKLTEMEQEKEKKKKEKEKRRKEKKEEEEEERNSSFSVRLSHIQLEHCWSAQKQKINTT